MSVNIWILRGFLINLDGKYYPMEKIIKTCYWRKTIIGDPLITFCAHLLQSKIFNICNFRVAPIWKSQSIVCHSKITIYYIYIYIYILIHNIYAYYILHVKYIYIYIYLYVYNINVYLKSLRRLRSHYQKKFATLNFVITQLNSSIFQQFLIMKIQKLQLKRYLQNLLLGI